MARAGGLRPPKHTCVLVNAKTLASSPTARARLLPAPLARKVPPVDACLPTDTFVLLYR